MKTITVTRVIYGKENTPVELREYSVNIGGTVGTKSEWIKWGRENGYKIEFKELTHKQKKLIKKLKNLIN